MATYAKHDTIETLSEDQLELLTKSDSGFLIPYIAEHTRFDAHRIRLLLELGGIEAARRLEVCRQNKTNSTEEKHG